MSRVNMLIAILFLLSFSLIVSQVWAHTPLSPSDEIHSLDKAFEVPNPTKSWALYRELHHEGEAEYYKLHLRAGERLRISLFIKEINEDFSPHLVIMGEALPSPDDFPDSVEKPNEFGAIIVKPSAPENPEYEPFTPTSYYYLIDVDEIIFQEADYYVAVYEPSSIEGKYGIAIGYKEEFTLSEWLLIPFDVIGIHQWEGQSLIMILSPLLVALFSGIVILWKNFTKFNLHKIVGSIAGFLYIGSGLMTLIQMIIALSVSQLGPSAVLTSVFIALPLLFGFFILRKIIRFKEKLSIMDRGFFIALGLIGFFTWSGLLLGPSMTILAGIFPNRFFAKRI